MLKLQRLSIVVKFITASSNVMLARVEHALNTGSSVHSFDVDAVQRRMFGVCSVFVRSSSLYRRLISSSSLCSPVNRPLIAY